MWVGVWEENGIASCQLLALRPTVGFAAAMGFPAAPGYRLHPHSVMGTEGAWMHAPPSPPTRICTAREHAPSSYSTFVCARLCVVCDCVGALHLGVLGMHKGTHRDFSPFSLIVARIAAGCIR